VAILAALAGLLTLHFWWRRRYASQEQRHRDEMARRSRDTTTAEAQAVARQRAVFDSMVEGLLLLDRKGRVQLANRRFIELFQLGDNLQGRTVLEATRSHELAELTTGAARQSGLSNRTLRLPGPQERHLEVNAAPIVDHDGTPGGMVIVLHDVSRLRRLEKTREEFVANVSHELRTPLSLIKGYSETLLDESGKDPEVVRRFLETIDRNARRLQFLIEDLLAISALESGRLQMNLHVVRLSELGEACVADYEPAARARDVTLHVDLPDLEVRVDEERLHQVLGNLLDNAIKYGRTPGRVTISARPLSKPWVEVRVQDDGPGIPSDSLDRVFERFYRVDRARSRDQGGTGLGLSIVKHIVQSHGGQVWAESEVGRGATIFFTLPLAPSVDG
jgi:two-component system phosphate regulon sensor histidine kinase PhoR